MTTMQPSDVEPGAGAPLHPRSAEPALLARLASFPEQNPNLVIEIDSHNRVSYLNPVARECFGELADLGLAHPLLAGLERAAARIDASPEGFLAREVDLGDRVFEQKICRIAPEAGSGLRVFASDVTELRRAHEDVRSLAQRVVEAQEVERLRISRELHDDAGQSLTALRIGLRLLSDELPSKPEDLRAELRSLVELVEDTHERIRHLARGLRPPMLDTIGLMAALRSESQSFAERTGLQLEQDLRTQPIDPSDAVATAIYRMVQEGLSNVARHAEASRVRVAARRADGRLEVEVVDDGCGFDPASLERAEGIGLRGLRERFLMLGAHFDIDSRPGQGTRLCCAVAMEDAAA